MSPLDARSRKSADVVITGGAGFIGSHLCDALLERGLSVVCVDDLSKGRVEHIEHHLSNPRFQFVRLDVRDVDGLLDVGRGCGAVVHLASSKIPRYESAFASVTLNLEGTRCALELARASDGKFVLASTSDVYGKSMRFPFDEAGDLVLGPSTSRRWSYAVTKLCDEHMAYAYQDEFGVPVTILRFFGTYGERQYLDWWGGPQGVFLNAIANREPVEIHGDGSQARCFIYVTDLVEATARALERDAANGEILNVGTDEEITILGLAELMHELSGVGGELDVTHVPYESFSPNYEDVRRRVPNLTKMVAVLDYKPRISLEEGVRRLWAWYYASVVPAGPTVSRARGQRGLHS